MKTLKRISAILLAVCCLLCALQAAAAAVHLEEGGEALMGQWKRGNGPLVDGRDIDYSYFSPIENGADAAQKYPLVLFFVGALEGTYEGHELDANEFYKWSSEELQARFPNGGAYLFIPRAPEEEGLYWDSSVPIPATKAALDDFIAANPNVDTDRIYVVGWCVGGGGVINYCAAYPDEVAACVAMSQSRAVTLTEARKMAHLPIWMMACRRDTYAMYYSYTYRSFLSLKRTADHPENLRLTSYRDVPDVELVPGVPFINNHNVWDNAVEDMHNPDFEYRGMDTVDGAGNHIDDPYVISWLGQFSRAAEPIEQVQISPLAALYEKVYHHFHEVFRTDLRNKIFELMTVIYQRMGWI